jgi:ATP-binding cassette subfamily B protein
MRKVIRAKTSDLFPIVQEIFKNTGNSVCITVKGNSMYPFLRDGIDEVELSRAEFTDIKKLDIVLARRPTGEYVLHRVVKKDEKCFYMLGDAQRQIEGPFYPGQLQAIVKSVRRKKKRISCDSALWLLLSWIWLICLPIRRYIIKIPRIPCKIGRMVKSMNNENPFLKKILFIIKWIYGKTKPFISRIVLITIINSLSSLCTVGIALASKNLVDSAVSGQFDIAIRRGIWFALFTLALLALNAVSTMLSVRVNQTIYNSINLDVYKSLSYSDWIAFSKYHSDDILTRMTSDVGVVVNGITGVIPGMISFSVQFVAAFIVLFSIDKVLGILAFALGPLTLLIYWFFSKKLREMHLKIQELEGTYRAVAHESILNMIIVKAFAMEKKSREKMKKIQEEQLDMLIRRNFIGVAAGSTFSIGYWAGYFLAFGWGTMRLSQGAATFGSLTAFLQLVGYVQTPFIGLARSVPQLIAAEASAGRIIELEEIESETRDEEKLNWPQAGIRFENISFSYADSETPVIENANLEIKPGEIAGIVGPSGEGKTTAIRLLLALIKPTGGKLYLVNGNEKQEVTAACRSIISYVPQGNTLFSGTIAENLGIANPDATAEEIEEALKQADAWQFIQEMPDGLQTKIGENALRLSEGQAQRISIARAFLKKSAILLLDEATSALDSKTEQKILESIKKMHPARTCIIITHRPSALSICSRVFQVRDGRMEEKSLSEFT